MSALNDADVKSSKMLYAEIKRKIEAGDVLSISSLSDLGDSYVKIIPEIRYFLGKGIGIIVKDLPVFNKQKEYKLDNIIPILNLNEMMIDMMDVYLRRKEDKKQKFLATVQAKGSKLGRPKTVLPVNFKQLYIQWLHKTINIRDILMTLKISRTTFYRYVKIYENQSATCANDES
jgi:hypothetical protein